MDRFPQISTVFDHANDCPHSLLYSGSIRNALVRLLPSDLKIEEFSSLLPIFKGFEWNGNLSIFLLCRHRVNGVKFFYEMISRWLIPGKRPNISSFFSTDFKLLELSDEGFTLCEIVVTMEEEIRHQLPILESEIRFGLTSVYHANRILEIKGLSADEKTSLIQERIASLLERRPKDFDHDIFIQMQHFLVMCSEEFKAVREYAHMSRIIYVFYLFKKALKAQIEAQSAQRFVHVKLSKTYLHLPFGLKKVLGIFAALNFQGDNELFEERHFDSVLKGHFPHLRVVGDSFFCRTFKEERTQLLYLEVEKEDGGDFSLLELKSMKEKLSHEIRSGIEKLARPLFMPRNEEEVMRNIITLSNQLKFSRDLPQVIISFDGQTEAELSYTIIWLRVLKTTDGPIQELFEQRGSFLKFIPDRIKRLGLLRNKYPKEATVFRIKFEAQRFLRPDHSVDLFKARQAIGEELQRVCGEFRDFNGGMIAKQYEQSLRLKRLFTDLDANAELLLENFFHSIFPIELRSLFNLQYIKNLFTLLQEAIQKDQRSSGLLHHTDPQCNYFLFFFEDPTLKEAAIDCIRSLQIPSSQLLTVSSQVSEMSYLGCIYREEDAERKEIFLNTVCGRLENLTFESQTH